MFQASLLFCWMAINGPQCLVAEDTYGPHASSDKCHTHCGDEEINQRRDAIRSVSCRKLQTADGREGCVMWTALIGPISNIAGQWLNNRQEKAVAKQKLAVAKIEALVKKVEQTGDWEELAMKASDNSLKDEAWTAAFIILILACMIPAAQPYIKKGS